MAAAWLIRTGSDKRVVTAVAVMLFRAHVVALGWDSSPYWYRGLLRADLLAFKSSPRQCSERGCFCRVAIRKLKDTKGVRDIPTKVSRFDINNGKFASMTITLLFRT